MSTPRPLLIALVLAAAGLTAGCDLLGIETPEKVAAMREAEGKAIGGACRHAARAIEDCFSLNRRAEKAAVFAGWREMNDYMRENKIEPVSPQSSVASAKDRDDVSSDASDRSSSERRPKPPVRPS